MELMVQVPVIDLRSFLSRPTGRLRRPAWPVGYVDARPGCSQFVRGFGELRTTGTAQTGGWEGRAQHVDARRTVRWASDFGSAVRRDLATRGIVRTWDRGAFHVTCRDRSFYGSQTSPRNFLQITLEIRDPRSYRQGDWQAIAEAVMDLPVHLPRGGRSTTLRRVGPVLARCLRAETTKRAFTGDIPTWAVTSGRPLFVGELDEAAGNGIEHSDLLVDLRGGVSVSYWEFAGFDACLVTRPPRSQRRPSSRYGLHLSRLHSERVTLTKLAEALVSRQGWLDIGRGSGPGWDLIQAALVDAGGYLTQKVAFGHDQRALLGLLQSDLVMHAAEWQALHRVLQTMRPTVSQTVVEALTIIEGDEVAGDKFENISGSTIINRSRVQNAFNALSSDGQEALRSELEELLKRVEETSGPEAADVAESFVEEVAGPRRRVILETLWNRLKELAPVVGGLAAAGTALASIL